MRVTVCDKVGVLSKISNIFARQNVSVCEMIQKDSEEDGKATLIFITHETREQSIRNAVAKVTALEDVAEVNSVIRVVS